MTSQCLQLSTVAAELDVVASPLCGAALQLADLWAACPVQYEVTGLRAPLGVQHEPFGMRGEPADVAGVIVNEALHVNSMPARTHPPVGDVRFCRWE